MLLKKNEDILLGLKFDEILAFMNTKLFDRYKVCWTLDRKRTLIKARFLQLEPTEGGAPADAKPNELKYKVDEFVQDAVNLRITAFMLDCYRHEYEDMVVCNAFLAPRQSIHIILGTPAGAKQACTRG